MESDGAVLSNVRPPRDFCFKGGVFVLCVHHALLLRRTPPECSDPPPPFPPPEMAPQESTCFGHKKRINTPPSYKPSTIKQYNYHPLHILCNDSWPVVTLLPSHISTSAEVPGVRGQIQTTTQTWSVLTHTVVGT